MDDDDESPLQQVVEAVRSALNARRAELSERSAKIERALAAYRRAVEEQLASGFALEHGLKQPRRSGADATRAANALLAAVRDLPELAEAPSSRPTLTESPPARPSAESTLPVARVAAFPLLEARLSSAKLVVIGALSGREKSGLLPDGLAEQVEWVDTERHGTHAIGNLPQRVRQGRVTAVVILDRAVQHRYTEPVVSAARDSSVPIAFAGQGGKASLLRALHQIEEMLAQREAE